MGWELQATAPKAQNKYVQCFDADDDFTPDATWKAG
jgi:hypothetical protein